MDWVQLLRSSVIARAKTYMLIIGHLNLLMLKQSIDPSSMTLNRDQVPDRVAVPRVWSLNLALVVACKREEWER